MEYLDFDILVEEKDSGYMARVIHSPAGQARAPFGLPFDERDLELTRSTIEKAVLRRASLKGPTRRRLTEEIRELRQFGYTLFNALLNQGIRDCYSRSWDKAREQEKGLRVKLRLPPSLVHIPWEFLYSPSERDFLVLSRYTPVVRYTELPHMPLETLRVAAPLRLLVVIANPENEEYEPLNVAREKGIIEMALKDLTSRGVIELKFLEGPNTFRRLSRRLRRRDYHVLHFIGHGDYDREHEEGVLVMEGERHQPNLVGAKSLERLLRDAHSVRLVVLNACQGTVTSVADPFSTVGMALVGVGVPAVVAMQFEITDDAAITLAHEFYTALADNLPVDAALAEARRQIIFDDPDTLEWATPVLFMRVKDGRLFALAPLPEAGLPEVERLAEPPSLLPREPIDEEHEPGHWRRLASRLLPTQVRIGLVGTLAVVLIILARRLPDIRGIVIQPSVPAGTVTATETPTPKPLPAFSPSVTVPVVPYLLEATATSAISPTKVPVPPATPTRTPTSAATLTSTPVTARSPTTTPTPSRTPTGTATNTSTPSVTPLPTHTPTVPLTATPTPSSTATPTPSSTATPTDTPAPPIPEPTDTLRIPSPPAGS